MSNETSRRWILLIGAVLILILLIYVIFYLLPGPPSGTIFTRIPPNIESIENYNLNENQNATDMPEPALALVTEAPGSDSSSNTGPDSSAGTSPGIGPESLIDTPEPGEPAPPPAPAQVVEVACTGPPSGWIAYTIQAGDTLTALALTSGSSVAELQRANCLNNETLIAGALFYLPQIPPSPTAIRVQTTNVPAAPSVTAVAAVVPTITLLPPTPVPITTTTLPEESNSLLWFLWVVMLVLLVGALIWVWQQRRQTR